MIIGLFSLFSSYSKSTLNRYWWYMWPLFCSSWQPMWSQCLFSFHLFGNFFLINSTFSLVSILYFHLHTLYICSRNKQPLKQKIIKQYFNNSYLTISIPLVLLAVTVGNIYAIFGAIRLHSQLDSWTYTFFPVIIAVVVIFISLLFHVASNVLKCSCLLLQQLKLMCCSNRVLKRRATSLLPFGVRVQPLQYVKGLYFLVFLRVTSDYTILFLEVYS